ncbi:MAG: LptF/LptG family permease [Sedimentisphaerales bacterium]|nr:LptF/LptG family permease [Sedimentisphaerales bacterium]
MVYTLQRYIFRELLKIFLLATIGLTLIVSLGSVLRPMQEYGVGPRQVLHILLYFMPITLTFVLPMAALFASALAYGRFASDNELDACRASGISIVTLVYPGLFLAILVAIANLLLSFHVMPYFVHLAEVSLKADARQILFRNIQRRGYYPLPPDERYLIYADHVDPATNTLYGIIVVESGAEGLDRIRTCEWAQVEFNPRERFNEVQLLVHNARQIGGDVWAEIGNAPIRQEFGSLLSDDIKFKRIDEMKQIASNLMLFDPIAKAANGIYARLVAELLAQDIRKTLDAGPGRMYELRGESRRVRLSAADCVVDKIRLTVSLQAPIVMEEYDSATGKLLRRLQCEKAVLDLDESSPDRFVQLFVSNARVMETGQPVVYYTVAGLAVPKSIRQLFTGKRVLQVVSPENVALVLDGTPSPRLLGLQRSLDREIRGTLVDIKAEVNSRLVFGIGCIPMILIGIGLGIVQRGGHLLGAFGVSCLPAALLGAAIISGKRLLEGTGTESSGGVLVMWGGLAFLFLLTAWLYRRLLRQ